jgi:predicted RNA binding protein YcfA (HicA-like mRNA interferase family)
MPQLPVLSGRRTARAFEKLGWQIACQRGSHVIMVKEGEMATHFLFLTTKKSPKAHCVV